MEISGNNLVFVSKAGCILPFLIIFNLFFGWVFFRPLQWIGIEILLVLIFALISFLTLRKMAKHFSSGPARKSSKNVIDIEAEVENDNKRLK